MTQNKEVQGMILQEKLDRMDFLSYMEQFKNEGRVEGYEERDRVKIAEMLKNGRSPESIADFCSYPLELVKEVETSIKAEA